MSAQSILIFIMVANAVLLTVGIRTGFTASDPASVSKIENTKERNRIPYAGVLTNPAGRPVADGLYDFSFALYTSESGGAAFWSETQKGISVTAGLFETALGRVVSIPAALPDTGARWLAVAVRGPSETEYTTLLPRQPLNNALIGASTSLSAAPACPHDHVGEEWFANVTWSNGAFKVYNYANGPTLWGWNGGNGNGVRGYATGTGLGVYGESQDNTGVLGRSTNGHGVEGSTTLVGKSGVYGKNDSSSAGGVGVVGYAPNGTGVYGQGSMFGVYVKGNLRVEGTSIFDGAKTGYVVEVAQNDDEVPLETGDVVMISGAGPPVIGQIPVIKVRRVNSKRAGAVVGVVDKHFTLASEEDATDGGAKISVEDTSINPGEYLIMVTMGAFKAVKADAAFGAIAPGDRLTASPNPGYAMQDIAGKSGTGIGKALGELSSGTGVIPVFVTLK